VSAKRVLLAVLLAELLSAVLLIDRAGAPATPRIAAPAPIVAPAAAPAASTTLTLPDGRTVHLLAMGGRDSAALLEGIAGEIGTAAQAVSAFWGTDWRRDIEIVATGDDAQFAALSGLPSPSDIAAVTTSERILFAPGAATMTPASLRIVLRHELFHYASRPATTADAPRWLTEGVADYVARPAPAAPLPADAATRLPTDADLDNAGAARSLAYDHAWLFSRYLADRYGAQALRKLYVRACGPGHPDVATAMREVLGAAPDAVVAGWRAWPAR
jgi:hypothetical protein